MTPSWWWSHWRGSESSTIRNRRSPSQRQSSSLWERCEPRTLLSLSINAASPTVVQDAAGGTAAAFTVTLNPADVDQTVAVDFRTVDASAKANVDYAPAEGTLTFTPGQSVATVLVPILGNSDPQGIRTFAVVLSNPANDTITHGAAQVALVPLPGSTSSNAGGQGSNPATGATISQPGQDSSGSRDETNPPPVVNPTEDVPATIAGDSQPAGVLEFGAATYRVSQDAGQAVITVDRVGGNASDVGIRYATDGGTAIAGTDYTPTSGSLTFGADESSHTFTVPILSNLLLGDNKTINLTLSDPTGGGSLGSQSSATLTIGNLNSLVVTSTNDSGPGSLRRAIETANANPGHDAITFDIPGPAPQVVALQSPLPEVVDPVTIDATTEPGYRQSPVITLDGSRAGPKANGLVLSAGESIVRGLAIERFSESGVVLAGKGGDRVEGNIIGTDGMGAPGLGNSADGVLIDGSAGNTIGGTDSGESNVIAGNGLVGVRLTGDLATGNNVIGNRIGTDPTGTKALGNRFDGVFVDGASGNVISSNVISGNGAVGLQIYGSGASGNQVLGNQIGTNAEGTKALGNRLDGVFVNAAPDNTIGGSSAEDRNVIAGNGSSGVQLYGVGATGNLVQGNQIGNHGNASPRLGNAYGLFLNGATGNLVGGQGAAVNEVTGNRRGNVVQNATQDGPSVSRVSRTIEGSQILAIVLNFSDGLDPGRAEDPQNYRLQAIDPDGNPGPRVPVGSASYDPVSRTVTLTLARPITSDAVVKLTVNGKPGRGLTDSSGRQLVARPAGDFTAILGRAGGSKQGVPGQGA